MQFTIFSVRSENLADFPQRSHTQTVGNNYDPHIKILMKEFLYFLTSGKTSNNKKYIQDFVILFLVVFSIGITISILKHYFYDIDMFDDEEFEMLNWKTFFSYVLIIPLFEEVIFRAPLLIPKANIYSISICILILIASFIYIENTYLVLSISIVVLTLQTLYLTAKRFMDTINKAIRNRYLILVIVSSISFGLLHMSNYEEINFQTLISVIGRIIAGFYFAYIVTKYDFKSSYFLHGINNIIPFAILFVAK